ncbi:MAG: sigma-70 family RNA polymerase sigma factor [Bacteroidales bacterium]|nr:sigma-70 family RNA polymerase sigma factor [Bacteroidales bacterium]
MKTLSNLSDFELVQDFIKGNQASIEILINRHRKKVYTYIVMVVKDQYLAEDIFQDTFIKVIKSLREGRYKDNGRFLSWVIRISHNLMIDHFRKEKQLSTVSNDSYETDIFNSRKFAEPTIEEEMIHGQITRDVRRLIQELPDDQREVVILRHFCGLSFKEIAEQTDVSINTALGRMRYALINLRRLIKEKDLSLSLK